jgi:NH3-dependent NAD+ synthetase
MAIVASSFTARIRIIRSRIKDGPGVIRMVGGISGGADSGGMMMKIVVLCRGNTERNRIGAAMMMMIQMMMIDRVISRWSD